MLKMEQSHCECKNPLKWSHYTVHQHFKKIEQAITLCVYTLKIAQLALYIHMLKTVPCVRTYQHVQTDSLGNSHVVPKRFVEIEISHNYEKGVLFITFSL